MMNVRIADAVLIDLITASTTNHVDTVLAKLPIVDPDDYQLDHAGPTGQWRDGFLHWLPVGMDRGNGGRIQLAGHTVNAIAERLVNGMEAIIELARKLELLTDPSASMPKSPRDAVLRYFGLPRLDKIPQITDEAERRRLLKVVNQVRRHLSAKVSFDKKAREFSVVVTDKGMGQEPTRIHDTLLSLGQTDKADKPYMIGVFGQGGSSAFYVSEISIVLSRRAPQLLMPGGDDGIGWSIVRRIYPKNRRDIYYAYLAATPQGAVPRFSAAVADAVGFHYGSRFAHIKCDFGGSGDSIARVLYQAFNHVLFNPILPYDLFGIGKDKPELMQGTAQRLARKVVQLGNNPSAMDKSFQSQPVGQVG